MSTFTEPSADVAIPEGGLNEPVPGSDAEAGPSIVQQHLGSALGEIDAALGNVAAESVASKGTGERVFDAVASAGYGVWKAGFETKDFLFGEPTYDEKSAFRQNVEGLAAANERESLANGLSRGATEFVTGMVGLGKVLKVTKLAKAGKFIGQSRKARLAVEAAKGATVNSVVFDPFEGRISDILASSGHPLLNNAVTRYLATDLNDSLAEARFKTALEGVGLDYITAGAFALASKVYKAGRSGNTKALAKAQKELDKYLAENQLPESDWPQGPTYDISKGPTSDIPATTGAEGMTMPPSSMEGPTSPLPGRTGAEGMTLPEPTAQGPTSSVRTGAEGMRMPEASTAGPSSQVPQQPEMFGSAMDEWMALGPTDNAPSPAPRPDTQTSPVSGMSTPMKRGKAKVVDNKALANKASSMAKGADARVAQVSDATSEAVLDQVQKDAATLDKYGSVESAMLDGIPVVRTDFPWQKLKMPEEVEAFLTNLSRRMSDHYTAAKGGAKQTDVAVNATAQKIAQHFELNPQSTLAALQKLSEGDPAMAARMEATDILATKALGDAWQIAQDINTGRLDAWGGNVRMAQGEFQHRMALAVSLSAQARATLSNAARTLRRARGDIPRMSYRDIQRLQSMPAEDLQELVWRTGGNLTKMRQMMNPRGFWPKTWDAVNFVMINGILSNPYTHIVNFSASASYLAFRPAEMWLGATAMRAAGVSGAAALQRKYALQMSYTFHGFMDAATQSLEALIRGDGVAVPKSNKMALESIGNIGVNARAIDGWVDAKDGYDVLKNFLLLMRHLKENKVAATQTAFDFPTRLMGAEDEMVKQLRARSILAAEGHIEGISRGLQGADLKAYVKEHVLNNFTPDGQLLHKEAVDEALYATLSQPLEPGSLGRSTMNFVNDHPYLRAILPFVRTPMNALKVGLEHVPMVEVLRKSTLRKVRGLEGPVAQAEALGRLTLGSIITGAAYTMAMNGMLTGAGPRDPKARKAWMDAGHRPYSFEWTDDDGTVHALNLSRFDPWAMPLTVVADLYELTTVGGEDQVKGIFPAFSVALIEQVNNRAFLTGLASFLNFVTEPTENNAWYRGQIAKQYVPYSGALRFLNPDPYMHQVRGALDGAMSVTPGMSDKLPTRYDVFGDPVLARNSLYNSFDIDAVDSELDRMAVTANKALSPPAYVVEGVDLRDMYLEDGENAYARVARYAGRPGDGVRPLKEAMRDLILSEAYQQLPDGDANASGTRQFALGRLASRYRHEGWNAVLRSSPKLRKAILNGRMASHGIKPESPEAKGLQELIQTFNPMAQQ